MPSAPWQHHIIIDVQESAHKGAWIVRTGTPTCGDVIGVPKLLQPQAPHVGDVLSYIVIGSNVLACALGEKLLWDYRVTLPAS